MGVDNPSGGPVKDPETTDKPAPPRNGGESPSTTPGADGRTPRIDSLRAAGWTIPERPDTDNGQQGDREDQSGESSSAAPAGEKPKTPADPSPETDPKAKEKPETGDAESGSQPPDEHAHEKPDPAQTGNSGTEAEKSGQAKPEDSRQDEGERGNAGPEPKSGRAETDETGGKDDPGKEPSSQDSGTTADDPAPSGEQSALPAEASQYPPGSRMESLARTRAEQHANAEQRRAVFQDTQATEGVDKTAAGENGDGGVRPDSENAGKSEPGQEAQPPGNEIPTGGTGDSGGADTLDGSDKSEPPTSGEGTEPPAPESARPQDQGHAPLPPQDSTDSGDAGGDPPTEPPADGMKPADDRAPDGQGDPPPGPEGDPPPEPTAENGPAVPEPGREASSIGSETIDQGTEPPEPKADAGGTGNEADAPQPSGETIPPAQEASENTTPPEALGEQSDGHGRNAEGDGTESDPEGNYESKPEVRPNPIISEVYTDSQGQVHVEPRYGREQTREPGSEVARNEPETTEPAGLPTREDLDPVGARGGEPGRGELRDPEDDPAERNPGEPAPERSSRRKELLKEAMGESEDIVDVGNKAIDGAFKALKPKPPTGHPCTARDTSAHMDPVQTPAQAGSAAIALIGTAIVVTQATRWTAEKVRDGRRRENADNR
ncbi:hypothetical protein [Actinomadura sp. K4S16]|uniref:hypothetical protein n=1 Tax=Actinomadura sp. K4S16 TaxID=1316147 RepID=UPI0011EFAC1B|nr:hypothetical protein [Actinomadura sp. K4S16]